MTGGGGVAKRFWGLVWDWLSVIGYLLLGEGFGREIMLDLGEIKSFLEALRLLYEILHHARNIQIDGEP